MPDFSLPGCHDPGKEVDPLILTSEFGSLSHDLGTSVLHLNAGSQIGIRDVTEGFCLNLLGTDQLHLFDLFDDRAILLLLSDFQGSCCLKTRRGDIQGCGRSRSDIEIEEQEEAEGDG
jgi:hypothetical protein